MVKRTKGLVRALDRAISKLTDELQKWRECADHIFINHHSTWFKQDWDISIDFKESDPIEKVNDLLKTFNLTKTNEEDNSNGEEDEKTPIERKGLITQDTGPLGYQ